LNFGAVVGDSVSFDVGEPVGDVVGDFVNESVGAFVGTFDVAISVGGSVGEVVGEAVGGSVSTLLFLSLLELFNLRPTTVVPLASRSRLATAEPARKEIVNTTRTSR